MRPIDADSVLKGIDELRKSPWYNAGKEIESASFAHVGFLERKEAIGVIVDLCIKSAPTIQPDAPRVMTLEEFAAAQKTPVWRETKHAHKDLYNGWMLAYDIQRGQGITGMRQGMTEPNGRVGWCKLDDYGKTWRCWTARPTDEQKKGGEVG